MQMKIRKATEKDLKDIAELFRVESSKPPYNKTMTFKKSLKVMKDDFKTNEMYVAIVDYKIVGFIMVKLSLDKKNKLWINEFWISKKNQRQGIGSKIINEIEKIYRKKGITIFELVANTQKGGACDFYKKLDYHVNTTNVYMEKKLK